MSTFMYLTVMNYLELTASKRETKFNLVLLSFPMLIACLIAIQVLLKPINFLFADDWLLLEYIIPNKGINFTHYFQLINGHNVLTTKLSLVLLEPVFNSDTLTAFFLFNLFLSYLSSIFILLLVTKNRKSSYSVILISSLFFYNFKQLQNYNMIISAHFLHSLFCITLYLFLSNNKYRKWRWIPLVVAPFAGGLGITVVLLEGYESCKGFWLNKRAKSVFSISLCIATLFLAYGLNFLTGNVQNNSPSSGFLTNISSQISHPWYLPSFILSVFGAPFTISSKFMSQLSQILGGIILILLFLVRKNIAKNPIHCQIIFIVTSATLLFAVTGYDGTSESIQNAYSNRYVTSTMLVLIVLAACYMNLPGWSYKKTVFVLMITLSLASGIKSGYEWVSVRSNQSELLERICKSRLQVDKDNCFTLSHSQSFISDSRVFRSNLRDFLDYYG
jgi:hypothetical protein